MLNATEKEDAFPMEEVLGELLAPPANSEGMAIEKSLAKKAEGSESPPSEELSNRIGADADEVPILFVLFASPSLEKRDAAKVDS